MAATPPMSPFSTDDEVVRRATEILTEENIALLSANEKMRHSNAELQRENVALKSEIAELRRKAASLIEPPGKGRPLYKSAPNVAYRTAPVVQIAGARSPARSPIAKPNKVVLCDDWKTRLAR